MIKQYIIEVETEDSSAMMLNNILVLNDLNVADVRWNATWFSKVDYINGFGPDESAEKGGAE